MDIFHPASIISVDPESLTHNSFSYDPSAGHQDHKYVARDILRGPFDPYCLYYPFFPVVRYTEYCPSSSYTLSSHNKTEEIQNKTKRLIALFYFNSRRMTSLSLFLSVVQCKAGLTVIDIRSSDWGNETVGDWWLFQ